MKRIIGGKTYDTSTAALIAEAVSTGEVGELVGTTSLYRNMAGVFFNLEEVEVACPELECTLTRFEWTVVGDVADARMFCEAKGLTIYGDLEGMPPEATVSDVRTAA